MTEPKKQAELERSQIRPAAIVSVVWFVLGYVVAFSGGANGTIALFVGIGGYVFGFLSPTECSSSRKRSGERTERWADSTGRSSHPTWESGVPSGDSEVVAPGSANRTLSGEARSVRPRQPTRARGRSIPRLPT